MTRFCGTRVARADGTAPEDDPSTRYRIVRMHYDDAVEEQTIATGYTLAEAQAHCRDPETRRDGVYFDGYTVEP